jgi:glyoxylase-like metal-dependent hydrolase (beta-lactamase superfamily II)
VSPGWLGGVVVPLLVRLGYALIWQELAKAHMGNQRFDLQIGHFNCIVLQDRDGNDQVVSDRNVLLVQTGQQQILIELGLGQDLIPGSPYPGVLRETLAKVGVSPTQIDLALITHADLDHIGGGVDKNGKAAFPNARYVLSRHEWEFWLSKPDRLLPNDAYDEEFRRICRNVPLERLAQCRNQLEIVDAETEVVPGIRTIAALGHTPGHTIIEIASGADRLLFIGDLIYEPKDMEDARWYSIYDFDPKQAIATRRRVFEQAARDGTLLMAYHLPFPGLGYVSQHGVGWRWRPFGTT